MESQDKNEFSYTYSASEQEELKLIRRKYLSPEEDKLTRHRRLDAGVTRKGSVIALIIGIFGALLLGIGMSCVLVWMGKWFVPGIFIGLVGIAFVAAAYPVYLCITRHERKKIAPEIMRLTDELLK